MKNSRVLLLGLLLFIANFSTLSGQSVTGQISGTLVDPTGAVIPGAEIRLTHVVSKQLKTFQTDSGGAFVFTPLPTSPAGALVRRPRASPVLS